MNCDGIRIDGWISVSDKDCSHFQKKKKIRDMCRVYIVHMPTQSPVDTYFYTDRFWGLDVFQIFETVDSDASKCADQVFLILHVRQVNYG